MITENGYIVAIENNDAEYDVILRKIDNRPTNAPEGYVYRLRADTLEWELVEVLVAETETNGYTEEQLSAMTNAELSVICAELGISGSMTKANMIALILDKQSQT